MKNGDLLFDLEKIKGFDSPITVSRDFDENLEYPFIIDVADSSYFYANEADRETDLFSLLKSLHNGRLK